MTEAELFQRLISLELELMAKKEDLKALREEAKDEGGIAKGEFSKIHACAKLYVADTFEEKTAAQRELEDKYKELTKYDEDTTDF